MIVRAFFSSSTGSAIAANCSATRRAGVGCVNICLPNTTLGDDENIILIRALVAVIDTGVFFFGGAVAVQAATRYLVLYWLFCAVDPTTVI